MLLRLAPVPPLAHFVECVWAAERGPLPHRRERTLPSGCADIVIPLLQESILRYDTLADAAPQRLRGGVLQGPLDRWSLRGTDGPSSVVGVHFRPGGAAALLGPAVAGLANRTVLLEDLWGPAARALRERLQALASPQERLALLQAHLVQRLHGATPLDPMVMFALRRFHRDPAAAAVQPVQRDSGLGPQRFIARFRDAVGLTPKRYGRVLRFHALVTQLAAQASTPDWAQVAAEGGYFDQSHLIHEFRALAGMTPSAYRPVAADMPSHVAVDG
jgi:AraC-like DNA-binding protein